MKIDSRYFTFTRRKNEDGEPSGVTTAFVLPSVVRSSVTVKPSDENADSFSSVAPSTPNASASRADVPISTPAMLTTRSNAPAAVLSMQILLGR